MDRRGVSLTEVDTPALRLDIGRFERNVGRLSASLRRAGVAWRPHSKAHKSPELAKSQIAAGAIGVTCAKVSEAEVMVDHGIGSVLIANELPLRAKLDRVARLERRAEVIVCADAPTHVEIASAAAQALGVQIPVMVDVDVGLGRTGSVQPKRREHWPGSSSEPRDSVSRVSWDTKGSSPGRSKHDRQWRGNGWVVSSIVLGTSSAMV